MIYDNDPEILVDLTLSALMEKAEDLTLTGHGTIISYSRKVFIPLTHLCRDVCHYCTFSKRPSALTSAYLTLDEVETLARAGEAAGCREALFTLGDRPETRFNVARHWLADHGYASTFDYLAAAAERVLQTTSLLPHLNPGLLDAAALSRLRPLAPSMGLMLENVAERLCEPGMPHHGSPDKAPAKRLEMLKLAGQVKVPFTTGLLIGIGETRQERIDTLLAIRDLHANYGHVQEVIVQNFRAKPGTRMSSAQEPALEEHLWTIAMARLLLGADMTIQAPPNLQPAALAQLIRAGVNDFGGVSPVTPDHVNPEYPWPHLDQLEAETLAAGRILRQRLTVGPAFVRDYRNWIDPALHRKVLQAVDGQGLVREDSWHPGQDARPPLSPATLLLDGDPKIRTALRRAENSISLNAAEIARLFTAQGSDRHRVVAFANELRCDRVGDAVTYVVNRNINYTNICLYHCSFCAFSKGSTKSERGPAYRLDLDEIARRTVEARARGATEVCLQGGIHPSYNGNTYLDIVRAVKSAVPDMHVHAFSPLEVNHGATTLGLDTSDFLGLLRIAGLGSLPGTAAEILSDSVRAIICPDKLNSAEWLEVMRLAHRQGLRTTATIMFGHVDTYADWATHLIAIRDLQGETGGFTEFVPLPFVHMEAPMWRRGQSRSGPTWRETLLMHSIARIALDGAVPNIQASWVKLGDSGVAAALQAGANDLGGTLMDESITRAAGGMHGQCNDVGALRRIAHQIGRTARQRNTLYDAIAPNLQLESLS